MKQNNINFVFDKLLKENHNIFLSQTEKNTLKNELRSISTYTNNLSFINNKQILPGNLTKILQLLQWNTPINFLEKNEQHTIFKLFDTKALQYFDTKFDFETTLLFNHKFLTNIINEIFGIESKHISQVIFNYLPKYSDSTQHNKLILNTYGRHIGWKSRRGIIPVDIVKSTDDQFFVHTDMQYGYVSKHCDFITTTSQINTPQTTVRNEVFSGKDQKIRLKEIIHKNMNNLNLNISIKNHRESCSKCTGIGHIRMGIFENKGICVNVTKLWDITFQETMVFNIRKINNSLTINLQNTPISKETLNMKFINRPKQTLYELNNKSRYDLLVYYYPCDCTFSKISITAENIYSL